MGRVKHELWVFCKAQLSAQIATIIDFTMSLFLASVCGLWYVYATFLGALSGGIANCVLNYQWVFKSKDLKKRYVTLKYLLVWTGSIWLNTGGTYLLTELSGQHFIFAKIVMAVMIALLWNYPLQRVFVYRDNHLNERIRGKRKRKEKRGKRNKREKRKESRMANNIK